MKRWSLVSILLFTACAASTPSADPREPTATAETASPSAEPAATADTTSPAAEPQQPVTADAGSAPSNSQDSIGDQFFTSRIPAGFIRSDRQGAIVLLRTKRSPSSTSFLSSIVAVPVKEPANIANLDACRLAAKEFLDVVSSHGAVPEPVRQEIISLPTGQVCQFEVRILETKRPYSVVNTMLQSPTNDRAIVCNIAAGDVGATEGCNAFLRDWRWNAPSE